MIPRKQDLATLSRSFAFIHIAFGDDLLGVICRSKAFAVYNIFASGHDSQSAAFYGCFWKLKSFSLF